MTTCMRPRVSSRPERQGEFHDIRRGHGSDRLQLLGADRLLEAVAALAPEQFTRPLGNSFSSIRDTIAHMCDAESIWLRRFRGDPPQGFQKPDRMTDVAAAREEWTGIEHGMRELLEALGPRVLTA